MEKDQEIDKVVIDRWHVVGAAKHNTCSYHASRRTIMYFLKYIITQPRAKMCVDRPMESCWRSKITSHVLLPCTQKNDHALSEVHHDSISTNLDDRHVNTSECESYNTAQQKKRDGRTPRDLAKETISRTIALVYLRNVGLQRGRMSTLRKKLRAFMHGKGFRPIL